MTHVPAELVQCADCYAIRFQDEMSECPEGHWVCPGCVCDCALLADTKMRMAQRITWEDRRTSLPRA